ncbi:MAG: SPOR domain-containing protein [Cytophagales bacterium]|nr:SPOR domain-containing protein [Cytophagales bacterium]MDW8384459.1 SPOR domain-containing protein [Flammeovirgaceae bacterium]
MIVEYIKDALIENGRVVVPALGTFKTEFQPAQLRNNGSLLLPPNAKVIFTDNIFSSDFDSLGDYIHSIEKKRNRLDIEEDIQNFVKEIQVRLREKEQFTIPDFGTFSVNKNGKLSFEPQEDTIFWAESFGLPKITTVPLFPISDEEEENGKVIITTAPIQRDEKKIILWILFVPFAVLLFFGLYLLYDKDAYQKVKLLIQGDIQTIEPLTPQENLPPLPETSSEEKDLNESISSSFQEKNVLEPSDILKENTIDTLTNRSTITQNSSLPSNKRFYIIVGSYTSLAKARSALVEFQKKGYANAQILQSDKIRISLADYATKTEAEQNLPIYKKEVPGAWILNY